MEKYERFKLANRGWLESYLGQPHRFWDVAAYSQPRLTRRLSNANKAKLEKLMDPATPIDTYIEGIGFKTPHRYDKGYHSIVYVIAEEPKAPNPANAERETIRLRRFDPASLVGRGWDYRTAGQNNIQIYMSHEWRNVGPVFLDRLTKEEREALALLYLLDDNGYIEGVGGVYAPRAADYRVFFLEKTSKPRSVE